MTELWFKKYINVKNTIFKHWDHDGNSQLMGRTWCFPRSEFGEGVKILDLNLCSESYGLVANVYFFRIDLQESSATRLACLISCSNQQILMFLSQSPIKKVMGFLNHTAFAHPHTLSQPGRTNWGLSHGKFYVSKTKRNNSVEILRRQGWSLYISRKKSKRGWYFKKIRSAG